MKIILRLLIFSEPLKWDSFWENRTQRNSMPEFSAVIYFGNFCFSNNNEAMKSFPGLFLNNTARFCFANFMNKWNKIQKLFWNLVVLSKKRISFFIHLLKHNLFKNVSNWVTFLWQTQIQTIKSCLNDTKRIKKKQVTLMLYSFTPSDMNFLNDFDAKVILVKFLSQTKKLLTWTILILSML